MEKRVFGFLFMLLLTLLSTAYAQPDEPTESRYGVPPASELVVDLSGLWRVSTVAFLDEEILQFDYDDSEWREVDVPARWSEQDITYSSSLPLVAVYRRTFDTLQDWEDREIGLAAWLVPNHSTVTLNGVRLAPEGEAPWLYANVTSILNIDEHNVLVVSTQFDGIYDMALFNPPRVGPLATWDLPSIQEINIEIEVEGTIIEATLYTGYGDEPRPGILMMGTGSHGLAFVEPFIPLARELAYHGYAALPIATNGQSVAKIEQALNELRGRPEVDAERIAVIGAVESAGAMLSQAAGPQAPQAIVTLSTRQRDVPMNLDMPVLLIATTQDALGPTSVYAARIAEQLAGPANVLVLPGSQSGLSILDSHWNDVREAILAWFDTYLR